MKARFWKGCETITCKIKNNKLNNSRSFNAGFCCVSGTNKAREHGRKGVLRPHYYYYYYFLERSCRLQASFPITKSQGVVVLAQVKWTGPSSARKQLPWRLSWLPPLRIITWLLHRRCCQQCADCADESCCELGLLWVHASQRACQYTRTACAYGLFGMRCIVLLGTLRRGTSDRSAGGEKPGTTKPWALPSPLLRQMFKTQNKTERLYILFTAESNTRHTMENTINMTVESFMGSALKVQFNFGLCSVSEW